MALWGFYWPYIIFTEVMHVLNYTSSQAVLLAMPSPEFLSVTKMASSGLPFHLAIQFPPRAGLLILVPIAPSTQPIKTFIWLFSEPGSGTDQSWKTKKTPKPAGLLFSRTIPQLVHREVHKLNTRTSVLDLSSGPFALCPAPSSSAEEQMLSEEGCKDSASTQKLIPGMRSQPPVTCDSGISWVKVSSF